MPMAIQVIFSKPILFTAGLAKLVMFVVRLLSKSNKGNALLFIAQNVSVKGFDPSVAATRAHANSLAHVQVAHL